MADAMDEQRGMQREERLRIRVPEFVLGHPRQECAINLAESGGTSCRPLEPHHEFQQSTSSHALSNIRLSSLTPAQQAVAPFTTFMGRSFPSPPLPTLADSRGMIPNPYAKHRPYDPSSPTWRRQSSSKHVRSPAQTKISNVQLHEPTVYRHSNFISPIPMSQQTDVVVERLGYIASEIDAFEDEEASPISIQSSQYPESVDFFCRGQTSQISLINKAEEITSNIWNSSLRPSSAASSESSKDIPLWEKILDLQIEEFPAVHDSSQLPVANPSIGTEAALSSYRHLDTLAPPPPSPTEIEEIDSVPLVGDSDAPPEVRSAIYTRKINITSRLKSEVSAFSRPRLLSEPKRSQSMKSHTQAQKPSPLCSHPVTADKMDASPPIQLISTEHDPSINGSGSADISKRVDHAARARTAGPTCEVETGTENQMEPERQKKGIIKTVTSLLRARTRTPSLGKGKKTGRSYSHQRPQISLPFIAPQDGLGIDLHGESELPRNPTGVSSSSVLSGHARSSSEPAIHVHELVASRCSSGPVSRSQPVSPYPVWIVPHMSSMSANGTAVSVDRPEAQTAQTGDRACALPGQWEQQPRQLQSQQVVQQSDPRIRPPVSIKRGPTRQPEWI